MSVLNFGNNQPLRSKVYPQAKVKLNARRDDLEYRVRAENNPAVCYFKGNLLKNDVSNHGTIEIEGEPAYMMIDGAWAGESGRFNGQGSRDLTNNSFSVPICTALNMLKGASPEELEEKIQWVGHIEMANQDNRERRVNLQCGGSMSTINNGPHAIGTNAYVRYRVPTETEANTLRSPYASEGQPLGAGGRVVMISEEFNIDKLDTFDPFKVCSRLNKIRHKDFDYAGAKSLRRDRLFWDLIKAYLEIEYVTKKNGLYLEPTSAEIKATAEKWWNIYNDYLSNDRATAAGVNALASLFRAMLKFKRDETRNVGCKASYGALPNTTMDIQHTSYMA